MAALSVKDGFVPGLEGVVAAETRLSRVDGLAGELVIGGFALEELAPKASFEEVVYLLWFGDLPTAKQLDEFRAAWVAGSELPAATVELLRAAAREQVPVMDALRMGASTLSLGAGSEPDEAPDTVDREALALVARFSGVVAAYWRLLNGSEPVMPRADLGHAANYLYMLSGKVPDAARVRALETYLNTVVDHGLNASTFTARVIASTGSDLVSAAVGAVGALKGPIHGGAPGPALDMVFEIGELENAESHMRAKLERGERLMGFGHRVYKVRDPRADVLGTAAQQLYEASGDMAFYRLVQGVEALAVQLLAEYKPGRNLQTNVEFYTALLLHGLGLPTGLFSPTFAVSRVAGWLGHAFEQRATRRLIRPKSVFVGEQGRRWVELGMRVG